MEISVEESGLSKAAPEDVPDEINHDENVASGEVNGEDTEVAHGGVDESNHQEVTSNEQVHEVKQTYKSWKKKFRKMRARFDEAMKLSNDLIISEERAVESAKRLAQENDQLLELLLDMNDSAQMPADKRIDLEVHTPTPSLSAIPSLLTPEEHAQIQKPSGNQIRDAIHQEILLMQKEKLEIEVASRPPKSLVRLLESTPHVTFKASSMLPEDLLASLEPVEGYSTPIGYLTADEIDEYLEEMDISMGMALPRTDNPKPAELDINHRNPHSVYNWLRQNEPKVFLQDGEGSEKSQGKPGSLRGAGKRAQMPHPSKPDALEIVEEDGLGYDPTIAGLEPQNKGKRKREDDGGYHPKLGAPDGKVKKPRIRKKKGEDSPAAASGSSSSRNRKSKARASTPITAESVEAAESAEPMTTTETAEQGMALDPPA